MLKTERKNKAKNMQNTAVNEYQEQQQIRREYETKLQDAITKNGGTNISNKKGDLLTDIFIAEPKGLYGVDEDTLIKIELITQSVEDGSVKAFTKEFGEVHFEFDFVGSKAQCYKYLHKHEQQNTKRVAELLSSQIGEVPNILEDDEPTFGSPQYNYTHPATPYKVVKRNAQTNQLETFKYQPHENLIDNASRQISEFYKLPFVDARNAIEEALSEVNDNQDYDSCRDSVTNKVFFEDVVDYAITILNPIPF